MRPEPLRAREYRPMADRIRDTRRELDVRAAQIEREIVTFVRDGGRLGVVQAPPGSGKTTLLLGMTAKLAPDRRRIAIATQTNTQADDICRRLAAQHPGVQAVRFASNDYAQRAFGPSVSWATTSGQLPLGPSVVVATAAKWTFATVLPAFDVLFVEEAWQLSWADFMTLSHVSARFFLIGDPGQIPPVISVDTSRWETSPLRPHDAAPDVILSSTHPRESWMLPATRRLPHDAVRLIRPFYNFEFEAYAGPGERAITARRGSSSPHDRLIDLLADSSVAGLSIPTPAAGPPLEADGELAEQAARLVHRFLERGAKVRIEQQSRDLTAGDIGIVATHRAMNSRIDLALPTRARGHVKVDTPERWQGLERPLMILVHPLSGVLRPSAFELETGRLCVMASRHQVGMVVLTRDHVHDTLASHINAADQPVGRSDVSGRGLHDNLAFWNSLGDRNAIVAA